jgi:8-oxo-dGTP pyrophosphatase MutT (NUDIX family)
LDRDRFPLVVHVLLLRAEGTQLFLLRRARTGFLDGYYGPPGGHVHAGELPMDAARRELAEETAVEAVLEPRAVMPYVAGEHQGVNFVFEALAFTGEPVINEPDLFDAAVWAPLTALPRPCPGWLGKVLAMRTESRWFSELRV